ncbi:zf-HC2 domain-containing protein [Hymenobacter terricola]|uniref:zf-HC2 domain-containing protein n=1 Tax=Hymenobacter terricola TaxID=2819236 RepID=UPI001B309A29|nr:zf-HC2 domain-containing protein [Hymenobacter terricola]
MNCESTKAQLADYLSGQLPEAEQQALEAHLAECTGCGEELEAVQRVWRTLGKVTTPEPSPNLRPEFYAMLAEFKDTLTPEPTHSPKGLWRWLRELQIPQPALRLAYSLALLTMGVVGGYWLNNRPANTPANQQQITALAAQVGEMRQMMLLALIDNPSATERLRAVSYTKELDGAADARVVEALLSTLNHDDNVNVRLATLEALAPLAADPTVRLGLVHALAQQQSPLVQSALADVMVQLQERRSVPRLRALLKQADLDSTVKSKIEESIQTLSTGRPAAPSLPPRHDQTHVSPRAEYPALAV